MPEVVVGRLARAHGLQGEIAVELRTDEPERRYAVGQVLSVRRPRSTGSLPPGVPPALTVAAARWHHDRLLVRFDEIADRAAAEQARGLVLWAELPPEERPEDPEEFYDHQLVGLSVTTTDGRDAGVVAEVVHSGPQDLLVVRREGRDDALIPFVQALVPEVDLGKGELLVADRPGLLEPDTQSEPGHEVD